MKVPFTIHIEITPDRGSGSLKTKRFETWRDMQKTGALMFDAVNGLSGVTVAEPGGGQQRSLLGSARGGMSGLARGLAVKPQMGEIPAQASITGFWDDSGKNLQPHPEKQVLHTGSAVSGPGAHPWNSNPTSNTDTQVKSLKTAIENALTANLPSSVVFDVFRIEYSGVIYGDRGYHFPR